ncbi:HigA family addiction module antitoxin [Polynucleobacter sp. AP-Latsch-80-C2]|jgi:addiction module HigA family antidote|uniref:HigA family addiction module antitoxin n=1 Tax=Polynucleobacter sp. AP-Latsch-80-C2 TaxID=2576931 RepID=UPI001C0E30F1|nr:HigA family addiction module antitoxin [Polynucleobacter sp. AP-Latsch-80-C2]MBU3623949.1 HigA family addiction module antidote protein [Polynucleobacter sp. AP-Latsch-80-C2]
MKKLAKSLRSINRKPTHPGAILREDVLPALGITQAVFASHLGVSRLTVSDLLHEKRGVSAEMAVRLARVVGGTPESWLHMQEALDLWEVEQKFRNHPESAPTPLPALALAA